MTQQLPEKTLPRDGTYSHLCPEPWPRAHLDLINTCASSHEELWATLHNAMRKGGIQHRFPAYRLRIPTEKTRYRKQRNLWIQLQRITKLFLGRERIAIATSICGSGTGFSYSMETEFPCRNKNTQNTVRCGQRCSPPESKPGEYLH